MVNPKKEPGFNEEHREHHKEKPNEQMLQDRWHNRMRSKLVRMSRGAQNIWSSFRMNVGWANREEGRRYKDKK